MLGKIDCLKRSVAPRRKETCTIVYRGHSFDDEWTIVEKFYRFEFISFPIGKTFRRRNNCVRKQPREKYTDFRIRSICKLLLLLLLASSEIIYLKFSNWNVWRRFLYYIFVLINFRKASAFFKIFVKILYFYRQSWTFQFFKSFVLCKLSNFLTSSSFQTFNCLLLFFFFFSTFKLANFQNVELSSRYYYRNETNSISKVFKWANSLVSAIWTNVIPNTLLRRKYNDSVSELRIGMLFQSFFSLVSTDMADRRSVSQSHVAASCIIYGNSGTF